MRHRPRISACPTFVLSTSGACSRWAVRAVQEAAGASGQFWLTRCHQAETRRKQARFLPAGRGAPGRVPGSTVKSFPAGLRPPLPSARLLPAGAGLALGAGDPEAQVRSSGFSAVLPRHAQPREAVQLQCGPFPPSFPLSFSSLVFHKHRAVLQALVRAGKHLQGPASGLELTQR